MLDFFINLKPIGWIFFGGCISVIGTGIVIFGTYYSNNNSSNKSTSILNSVLLGNDIAEGTSETVTKLSSKITYLQEKNDLLQTQVNFLTQQNDILRQGEIEINDNITGGTSSCYLEFRTHPFESTAYVFLRHEGKSLLREIDITIKDHTNNKTYERHYGTVKVINGRKLVMDIPFASGNENVFSILISSFNNSWNEQVVIYPGNIKRHGQVHESVYRLYQLHPDKTYSPDYKYQFIKQGNWWGRDGEEDKAFTSWEKYKMHLTEMGPHEQVIK